MKRRLQPGSLPLALVSFFVFAGCTTEHYRKSADKEAYGVIRQKTPLVKNMDEHFTVEQTNQLSLDGLPGTTRIEEFLGPDGEAERGAREEDRGAAQISSRKRAISSVRRSGLTRSSKNGSSVLMLVYE